MEIKKDYLSLIVVAIILVFILGLFYFLTSSFKNAENPPLGNQNNVVTTPQNTSTETSQQKTLSFVSVSCSASINGDTIKFKIQSIGITIEQGEMTASLDDVGANFKDTNGSRLNSISLSSGETTNEFSYTTASHKDSRKIVVSTPAGSFDQVVTCS